MTKRTVYRIPPCPIWDLEATESWLGDLAKQGLHLKRMHSLLDFADEVEIAGGIENIDLLAVPDKIHKRCGDRAVFFYFFGVEIADRVAVCDLT